MKNVNINRCAFNSDFLVFKNPSRSVAEITALAGLQGEFEKRAKSRGVSHKPELR